MLAPVMWHMAPSMEKLIMVMVSRMDTASDSGLNLTSFERIVWAVR